MLRLGLLFTLSLLVGTLAAEEKTHIIFVPQGDDVNAANKAEIEKQKKDGLDCKVVFQRTVLKGAQSFTEVTFKCTRLDPEHPRKGSKCCAKMETTETHITVDVMNSGFKLPGAPDGGWMPLSVNTTILTTIPGKGRQAATESILVSVVWFRYPNP